MGLDERHACAGTPSALPPRLELSKAGVSLHAEHTGAETDGAYFAMEALVPPGGGPPPHIHRNEDETFYVVEGQCSIRLGHDWITAGVGDFVNVPRGTVHCFHNDGTAPMRMILTFTPAGIERFFEETLERALDPTLDPPDAPEAVAARYAAAAPRYGMEFLID